MSYNLQTQSQQDAEYNQKYNHLLPNFANLATHTSSSQQQMAAPTSLSESIPSNQNYSSPPHSQLGQNHYSPNQRSQRPPHQSHQQPPPQPQLQHQKKSHSPQPHSNHHRNQQQQHQPPQVHQQSPSHNLGQSQHQGQINSQSPPYPQQQGPQYSHPQNSGVQPNHIPPNINQRMPTQQPYDNRQDPQRQNFQQRPNNSNSHASQPGSQPITQPAYNQQRSRQQQPPVQQAPPMQYTQRRPPPQQQYIPQPKVQNPPLPYPISSPSTNTNPVLTQIPQHLVKQIPVQNQSQPPQSSRVVSMPMASRTQTVTNSQTQTQPLTQSTTGGRTMSLSASTFRSSNANPTPTPQSQPLTKPQVHHTFSLSSKSRSFTSLTKSTLSLSQKRVNSATSLAKTDKNNSQVTLSSQKTILTTASRKPTVYPALLSRVAVLFKDSILLAVNKKDGLEYHDSFTGKQAVDSICKIIRTNDRNLALLLGRSIDAQKYFHDVTYSHRLRDSPNEVYAFNNTFSDGFYSHVSNDNMTQPSSSRHGSYSSEFTQSTQITDVTLTEDTNRDTVNGVFTILTDCYSPTCTRNKLCYSIACPRRLEQQARLHMKPEGGLKRAESRLSFHENETKNLWHDTVPQNILDTLDKNEKQKQELIYEFIYTERDYVKDLEFMTDFYIMPLRRNDVIPEREREAFIRTVFGGVSDLLQTARPFSDSLTRRQQQQKPVIETLGDLVLSYLPKFEPFIKYGGNKCFASFEHERQQKVNPRYSKFLTETEKKPESRRNDLSSFLIKGIQRPAKYQLLLQGIIKHSAPDSPDYKNLVKAHEEIGKLLKTINIQSGISADRHKIMVLHSLLGKQILEEKFFFKLDYKNKIIYQATLSRKRDNEKIDLYLFEHALLLVKHKIQNKREQYKVFEKPVLLPLLFANTAMEFPTLRLALQHKLDGSIVSDNGFKPKLDNGKFAINFLSLGNSNIHATLFADDTANQNQVVQQIFNQQRKLIKENDIFSSTKFETRRFSGNNRINCAVPCYGGKKLLYGTDSGVWVSTVRTISVSTNEKICSDPTLVIDKVNVTQIEVLVEYSKLLILTDKKLYEFDLSCTDSLDHMKNTRTGREILDHVSFFKTGICDGKLLVCAAKIGSTHSINIFEPGSPFDKKLKNKKYEIREFQFTSDPVSISFLKTKLCIGCTKGFEILSLEKGKKEPILDEADVSLDFATQRESVNPLAIHRLGKEFLLSYSEFSFLINRNGWRTNHNWGIYWEGIPQNIALFYPYLLSFEPGFIEVRDLSSTTLLRAVVGENIRFLHSNEHEALYACEENGYDIIVSIDFLNLKPKPSSI